MIHYFNMYLHLYPTIYYIAILFYYQEYVITNSTGIIGKLKLNYDYTRKIFYLEITRHRRQIEMSYWCNTQFEFIYASRSRSIPEK